MLYFTFVYQALYPWDPENNNNNNNDKLLNYFLLFILYKN